MKKRRKSKSTDNTRGNSNYRRQGGQRDWNSRDEDSNKREDSVRNDISWYTRNPNLTIAAGSFPYPYRPGMNMTWAQNTSAKRTYTVPGFMILDWMPSIGYSATATDPASVLAKEVYAKVRSVFSGSINADAPDFVMYILAMDSIYSYIAWLKRLYRCLSAWTPENYALPEVLISGFGLSNSEIQALRENKTRLWQLINELVLQSRKFKVPANMDIFNRHYWMSDNVYTDWDSINSQMYAFNLKAVLKYAEQNMPSGDPASGLAMTWMPTAQMRSAQYSVTVDVLYEFGRGLIDALVAWDEAYEISGYLMRAYEGVPSFIVAELDQSETLTPVYSAEVLSQIENSRTIPNGQNVDVTTGGFNISQDVLTNAVLSNPKYTLLKGQDTANLFKYQGYAIEPWLSVRSMTPTVADNVIASRLHNVVVANTTTTGYDATVICATEIGIAWRLVTAVGTPTAYYTMGGWTYHATPCYDTISAADQSVGALATTIEVDQFDWHPLALVTIVSGTEASPQYRLAVCGDVHNFTQISNEDLKNLHKVCLFSELNSFSA